MYCSKNPQKRELFLAMSSHKSTLEAMPSVSKAEVTNKFKVWNTYSKTIQLFNLLNFKINLFIYKKKVYKNHGIKKLYKI